MGRQNPHSPPWHGYSYYPDDTAPGLSCNCHSLLNSLFVQPGPHQLHRHVMTRGTSSHSKGERSAPAASRAQLPLNPPAPSPAAGPPAAAPPQPSSPQNLFQHQQQQPPSVPPNAGGDSGSTGHRHVSFISGNKRGIVIGVAAVGVGGVAYYVTSSRAHGEADEESLREKKDKKKKEPGKTVYDQYGPILAKRGRGRGRWLRVPFPSIKLLSKEVSPHPEPVFYSNLAACYHEKVVADCNEALKLDAPYVKALNRRATALEALERYEDSLRDYTAATILGKFQNDAAARSVERVLEKLSKTKAAEILATESRRASSHTFISAYFSAFRPHMSLPLFRFLSVTLYLRHRPLPTLPENPSTGDNTLILALEALGASDHVHSLSLINEAIEQGISWEVGRAEALNLRGSFKSVLPPSFCAVPTLLAYRSLMGDTNGTKADLEESMQLVPSCFEEVWPGPIKVTCTVASTTETTAAANELPSPLQSTPDPSLVYFLSLAASARICTLATDDWSEPKSFAGDGHRVASAPLARLCACYRTFLAPAHAGTGPSRLVLAETGPAI
ncbi:hypothetical protein EDB84DRAFT_1436556 [Lactarius hengduanensis]|nr:hypothetical protein EDB84DRAFT_1436556 [Lactarius hengduanensis]